MPAFFVSCTLCDHASSGEPFVDMHEERRAEDRCKQIDEWNAHQERHHEPCKIDGEPIVLAERRNLLRYQETASSNREIFATEQKSVGEQEGHNVDTRHKQQQQRNNVHTQRQERELDGIDNGAAHRQRLAGRIVRIIRTLEGMGITPDTYETIVPTYLYRFRKAGQFDTARA